MSDVTFKNLHDYISSLPPGFIRKIYSHPVTCFAVFRALDPISKQIILRMILIKPPIPTSQIISWFTPDYVQKAEEIILKLSKIAIVSNVVHASKPCLLMEEDFGKNIYSVLFNGYFSEPIWLNETDDQFIKISLENLAEYMRKRWDVMLQFLINHKVKTISDENLEVLIYCGLLQRDGQELSITGKGFNFLLMEVKSQIWFFIISLIDYMQASGHDATECLVFLFQLSFSEVGKVYSCENFSPTKEKFLQQMREVGLVFQKTKKIKRFVPTDIAINISSGVSFGFCPIDEGYIIVESNYRVYAYTDQDLKIEILSLFVQMLYKLPSLCVGVITRDSVRAAFSKGITAESIINFLQSRIHNVVKNPERKKALLPPTVVDQIKLWEMEQNRVTYTNGYLYSMFSSDSDFKMLCDYAKDLGVLEYSDAHRRIMVISEFGHEEVRRYWKQNKPKVSHA